MYILADKSFGCHFIFICFLLLTIIFIDHPILQHVEALEVLLQGLSGVPKERVRVHELCLKSGPNLG